MSIRFLKIKIKSLAYEASAIRHEEHKLPRRLRQAQEDQATKGWTNTVSDFWLRQELHAHRTGDMRIEQRAAFVAYGFLRGRSYHVIEPHAKWKLDRVIPAEIAGNNEQVHRFQSRSGSNRGPDWIRVARMIYKYGSECANLPGNVDKQYTTIIKILQKWTEKGTIKDLLPPLYP